MTGPILLKMINILTPTSNHSKSYYVPSIGPPNAGIAYIGKQW